MKPPMTSPKPADITEQSGTVRRLDSRFYCTRNGKFYVRWEYAGGPDQCKHGYAACFACPDCEPEPLPVQDEVEGTLQLIPQIKHVQGLVNDERPQMEVLFALDTLLKGAYALSSPAAQPESRSQRMTKAEWKAAEAEELQNRINAESVAVRQDIGKYHFHGKPLDSECFYGYHRKCNGCNCSCHDSAPITPSEVNREPESRGEDFDEWADHGPGDENISFRRIEWALKLMKVMCAKAWNAAKSVAAPIEEGGEGR